MNDEPKSARHFLNALRNLGPPGGTMISFPFEALFAGIEERDRAVWNAAIRAAADAAFVESNYKQAVQTAVLELVKPSDDDGATP